MEISAITSQLPTTEAPHENAAMRDAAEQVEGMFLKMMMKEGMKGMIEEAGHAGSALEYALEQTADEAGRAGSFGIADQIYEQLSGNL